MHCPLQIIEFVEKVLLRIQKLVEEVQLIDKNYWSLQKGHHHHLVGDRNLMIMVLVHQIMTHQVQVGVEVKVKQSCQTRVLLKVLQMVTKMIQTLLHVLLLQKPYFS